MWKKNQQQQVAKNAPTLSIRDLPQCYGNRNVSLLLLLRVTYLWCLFSFGQLFINRNGGRWQKRRVYFGVFVFLWCGEFSLSSWNFVHLLAILVCVLVFGWYFIQFGLYHRMQRKNLLLAITNGRMTTTCTHTHTNITHLYTRAQRERKYIFHHKINI